MIQANPPSTHESMEAAYYPSLQHPAVAICTEVWQKIHTATLKQTKNLYTAERYAGKSYRMAMPPLSGYQNICDFIACATYGMLLGAIKHENGAKLLYAAQVALATVPRGSKTQTQTRTPTEPIPSPHPTPPPLLPQTHKKKRITSKTPASPHQNKELTALAAGEIPGHP